MAVTFDTTWGNVSAEEAQRMGLAAWEARDEEESPHHAAGETEPWISRLVASFVIATGARAVLETGGFTGATSAWIVQALDLLKTPNSAFTICEIDPMRAAALRERFDYMDAPRIAQDDILHFLSTTAETFDFAWVDDCHEEKHVRQELELLYPKIRRGGLILMHDVCGVCPGNQYPLGRICNEFGGYVLNLPRLGMAGGLGIIQVPFA